MKKILIIQNINEAGPKLLTDHPDYEFEIIEDINDPSLKEKIEDCDGASLRTAKLSGEIINLGKKLKIISRHGVGYDNIDLDTCKKNVSSFLRSCKYSTVLIKLFSELKYWIILKYDPLSQNNKCLPTKFSSESK